MSNLIASGDEKIHFDPNLIYDRVINLKITIGKADTNAYDETIIIRSDYEIVYNNSNLPTYRNSNDNSYFIRRCTQKPSIKVQYSQVTNEHKDGAVGTTVDVYLSNFFMLNKDGTNLISLTTKDYTVKHIDIYMGYFGQFEDKNIDKNSFYDLKAQKGAAHIEVTTPIVVRTEKLPPDSVICISGAVGSVLKTPVGNGKLPKKAAKMNTPSAVKSSTICIKSGNDLEKIFYEQITRRYMKTNIKENIAKPVNKPEVFQMSDSGAKKWGIKVYLSKGAKKSKIKHKKDSKGNEVETVTYFETGYLLGDTLQRIFNSVDSSLIHKFLNTGDMLIYTQKEAADVEKLYESFKDVPAYTESVFNTFWKSNLPAVYNINIDAMATIICPFFSFIEPFQPFRFASRYALTSNTAFWASYEPTITDFIAEKLIVSFATVEPVNEMQISAISVKK